MCDGRADGRTDGRTDRRVDGRTHPVIEMRERIQKLLELYQFLTKDKLINDLQMSLRMCGYFLISLVGKKSNAFDEKTASMNNF